MPPHGVVHVFTAGVVMVEDAVVVVRPHTSLTERPYTCAREVQASHTGVLLLTEEVLVVLPDVEVERALPTETCMEVSEVLPTASFTVTEIV